ncbi:MAG TPA: hypothetical protein PLQ76_05220, partial [bacterium]|nr:hypothetical protein [bacterium]
GLIVCVTTGRSAGDYMKGGAEIFRYVWPSIHEAFNWLVHRIAAPFKTPEYLSARTTDVRSDYSRLPQPQRIRHDGNG